MAKTRIKKGVVRKIKTADFEQLDIIVEIEEDIEYQNDAERLAATKKVSERLLEDFTATYNEIVQRLGVNRCIGTVNTDIKMNKKASKNDDIDFDLE